MCFVVRIKKMWGPSDTEMIWITRRQVISEGRLIQIAPPHLG